MTLDRFWVLTRLHDLRDRPDAELVRLVADRRDEAAFELLVRRYGPLVRGVCRRALGDHAAADDAFQATFLLLARRAPALRQPAGVARWLYGTAARTAREAGRHERRRRRRERAAARPEAVAAPPADRSAAVDAAVRRLPEPYRSAVLLCDLSGLTRDQAARELGVPAGTVASRVSRGRALLGAALARQGVTLSAGLAALVPADLAAGTVRIGVLLAAGEAVPAAVGGLLTHGSWVMPSLKVGMVAAGLLAAGGLATVGAGGPRPADPPPATKSAVPTPTPAERLAQLRAAFEAAAQAATKEQKDPKTGEVIGYRIDSAAGMEAARYLPELLKLGESEDEETAVAALSFAVLSFAAAEPDNEKAFRRLVERFARTPRLVTFAREQQRHTGPGGHHRVELLLVSATDHTARGLLEMHLADGVNPMRCRYTAEVPENTEARRELAALRYRRVVAGYGDVDDGRLARRAEAALQQLAPAKHLRVGATAPATAGTDLDGRPMALADFRGRVVVLEFWGSWCGPCVRATPGLNWVAKEYTGRGVVVLGVMAETDAAAARKTASELGVTWRNWLDLRADGRSPIVTAWEVFGFPTTVVLDRAGVVRAVNPDGRAGLERALDELLAAEPAKP